jgi:hypothetical protein
MTDTEWQVGQRVHVSADHPYGPGTGTIMRIDGWVISVHLDYPTWAIICQPKDLTPALATGGFVSEEAARSIGKNIGEHSCVWPGT